MPTLTLDELTDDSAASLPLVETTKESALATVNTRMSAAGIDADTTSADIKLPRINLLQKSSELAEAEGWAAGDIAFNKAVKLVPYGQSAKVTFLKLKKQYQEHLPYGSDTTPRTYDTREEVFRNGGSIEYGAPNEFRAIAHLTMLIEAPEDADDETQSYFPLSFGGKDYSLAVWTVSSSAYNKVAKELITAAEIFCRDGIHRMAWKLWAEKSKSGTNTFYVPRIAQAGKHTPEMVDFLHGLMGA